MLIFYFLAFLVSLLYELLAVLIQMLDDAMLHQKLVIVFRKLLVKQPESAKILHFLKTRELLFFEIMFIALFIVTTRGRLFLFFLDAEV